MKFRHYLVSMLACAAAVVSCEEPEPVVEPVEPSLEVNPFVLAVAQTADEATFTITTNQAWTAESDQAWATLDITSGEASEEPVTVKVTVAENTAEEERVATITVTAAELTKTVRLTQAPLVILENGTQEKPWLIKTAADLVAMKSKAVPYTETFFKLEADIDMTGVTGYVPVNISEEEKFDRKIYFDGNNKTISNFTCSSDTYPSLFGVLYGTVKNLTVTGAKITSTTPSGIIAGYAGTFQNETVMPAVLENVNVTGEVTATSDRVGGLAGVAYHATFTNCTADVKITASKTDVGGFVGKAQGDCVFTGCNVKANITSTAPTKNRVGGLVGWNSTTSTVITDCHVLEGTVLTDMSERTSLSNGNYAGLLGYGDTTGTKLTISNCTVNAVIEGGDYSSYNSGLIGCIGYADTVVEVTDCFVAGSIKGSDYAAGLAGVVQNATSVVFKRCGSTANIVSNGKRSGGLFGSVLIALTVEDCYCTGDMTATGQQCAGLVGFIQGALTLKNCFATGNITNQTSGAAGLVGTINNGQGSVVSKCIAWNKEIVCNRASADAWAPGAIVGAATAAGTFTDCYRRSDMTLVDAVDAMKLVDHENITNAAPPQPEYVATITKNQTAQQAYHGKAAAADATISSLAKSLGWDETVWDLSKDVPALK